MESLLHVWFSISRYRLISDCPFGVVLVIAGFVDAFYRLNAYVLTLVCFFYFLYGIWVC